MDGTHLHRRNRHQESVVLQQKLPGLWLSLHESGKYRYRDFALLQWGATRTIQAAHFPIKSVWFCLCALGVKTIVTAIYDAETSALHVEFVSIVHAARAAEILRHGNLPGYPTHTQSDSDYWGQTYEMQFDTNDDFDTSLVTMLRDSTNNSSQDLHHTDAQGEFDTGIQHRVAAYMPQDHLEQEFNRLPFNQTWPDTWSPIMEEKGLHPRLHHDPMLESIQRGIVLSRKSWSWEIPQEAKEEHDNMIRTLRDPHWRDSWEVYYRDNSELTENLLRWDEYAAIARHREGVALKQRLAAGRIFDCAGCEYGCGERMDGISQVILDFLDGKIDLQADSE